MLQMQQVLMSAGLSLQDAPTEPSRRPVSQLQGGSKYSALHNRALKPPVLPLPPCPPSTDGHMASCLPSHQPCSRPSAHPRSSGGCLSVCLAAVAGRQGSRASHSSVQGVWPGLRQPRSALQSCGNGRLPLLFFLFAHLLRIVAAAKIKTKYRVSV